MRCAYVDLDGTLLGRGASLFHDGAGEFTMLGVRAIEACHRAEAEVVLYSGRRKAQVFEDARLLGQRSYIFEAGCGFVLDGEEEYLTGGLQPGDRSIHDQITESGAPSLLLGHYAGRLEYHSPWHVDREVSHLFRGEIDAFEADELLREHGHGDLRVVDNGAIARHPETLPEVDRPHAYHLIPSVASKAGAVGRHMQARGYRREEVIAVGDSREDLGTAEVVGTFWLVANALQRDPSLGEVIAGLGNVRIAEERHGAGVYEAVVTTLAERR